MMRDDNRRLACATAWVFVLVLLALAPLPASALYVSEPRAKSSKVQRDMKHVEAALLAYHTDHRAFPPAAQRYQMAVQFLTTPVAYLSKPEPTDPFKVTHFQQNRFGKLVPILEHFVLPSLATWLFACLVLAMARAKRPVVASFVLTSALAGVCWLGESAREDAFYYIHSYSAIETQLPPGDSTAFNYWTDGNTMALLASVGVDGKADVVQLSLEELSCIALARASDSTTATTATAVMARYKNALYDPTNGVVSGGDICRLVMP